jgi:hemerythrin
MALLDWSDKYSVGVKAMDNQHIALIEIVNKLHAAMSKGLALDITAPLLRELVAYTQEHFAAEEALIRNAKFPNFAGHQALHRELIHQIEDFTARLNLGQITLNIQLMTFLRDWLANHIMKEDKQYGLWLNAHGIQ